MLKFQECGVELLHADFDGVLLMTVDPGFVMYFLRSSSVFFLLIMRTSVLCKVYYKWGWQHKRKMENDKENI